MPLGNKFIEVVEFYLFSSGVLPIYLLLCYCIKERCHVGPNCSADTIYVVFLARIYCWEATSSSVCTRICVCVRAQTHTRLACLQSRHSSLTPAGHIRLLWPLSPVLHYAADIKFLCGRLG